VIALFPLVSIINTGIVQEPGIGLVMYDVMEIDLRTLSIMNILVKYADDDNFLVPADTDLDLAQEFNNIKHWAAENKTVINLHKTKEIVFRRPKPRLFVYPDPLDQVQQVSCAKPLSITFKENLKFVEVVHKQYPKVIQSEAVTPPRSKSLPAELECSL